jgi:hypothetical protein
MVEVKAELKKRREAAKAAETIAMADDNPNPTR